MVFYLLTMTYMFQSLTNSLTLFLPCSLCSSHASLTTCHAMVTSKILDIHVLYPIISQILFPLYINKQCFTVFSESLKSGQRICILILNMCFNWKHMEYHALFSSYVNIWRPSDRLNINV